MYTPDVVYGLMHDGDEVAETIRDLEAHGVFPTEIEVSSPPPGRYALADEYLHEDALATMRGAAGGAAVGAVLGVALAAAIGTGTIAGITGWILFAIIGAGFGAMVGAMAGMQRAEHGDDDDVRYADVSDGAGWKVVAVRCLHWRNRAHGILLRHGAEILDSPVPAQHA